MRAYTLTLTPGAAATTTTTTTAHNIVVAVNIVNVVISGGIVHHTTVLTVLTVLAILPLRLPAPPPLPQLAAVLVERRHHFAVPPAVALCAPAASPGTPPIARPLLCVLPPAMCGCGCATAAAAAATAASYVCVHGVAVIFVDTVVVIFNEAVGATAVVVVVVFVVVFSVVVVVFPVVGVEAIVAHLQKAGGIGSLRLFGAGRARGRCRY